MVDAVCEVLAVAAVFGMSAVRRIIRGWMAEAKPLRRVKQAEPSDALRGGIGARAQASGARPPIYRYGVIETRPVGSCQRNARFQLGIRLKTLWDSMGTPSGVRHSNWLIAFVCLVTLH
jgi:hypothetical protein